MKKVLRNDLSAIPFLLPFTILYLLFTIWPMGEGIYVSFYKWNLMGKVRFVGSRNWARLFSDYYFWESLWHTVLFVILSTPTLIVLGLILALICNQKTHLRKLYRVSFFLPNVLTVSVVSYISLFMFQPYTGFINTLLHTIGIKAEPYWLADPNLAWFTIVITTLWWTVGFNMILYLSALQDIPDELYEAAAIDGATGTDNLLYITLPMLRPITFVILLLQILSSFKVFAQPYLITAGGPGTATRPLIQYIYETGFTSQNLGYASTMSYGLFVILLICTLVQLKFNKQEASI